jgi:hypothetical protein
LVSLLTLNFSNPLPLINASQPHRRHYVEEFLCCPVGCHRNLVFTTCYLVTTSSMLYVVRGTWFPICCPTMDIWPWAHNSSFQPLCHSIYGTSIPPHNLLWPC